MSFLKEHVGNQPFAKIRIEDGAKRRMSSFNAAVSDAVAVGLAEAYSSRVLRNEPDRVASKFKGFERLFADHDFFSAVSGSVNDAAKVNTRIESMVAYLTR